MFKKIFKCLAGAVYAGALAYAVGNWAICDAYIRRGYEATGGEYFLFPAVFLGAYKAIQFAFNVLEGNGADKEEAGLGVQEIWAAEYMGMGKAASETNVK